MADRMQQVDEQLRPLTSTPTNLDFAPVAYSFDVVLWSAQFGSAYSVWFRSAAHFPFRDVLGVVMGVLLFVPMLMAFIPSRERRLRLAAACCTVTTGFTLMALQIFLLLGFESVYGYVYHELSILIGLCMGGIALGSWLAVRRTGLSGQSPRRMMTATQMLLAASGPVLLVAISQLGNQAGAAVAWAAAQLFFPILAALSGTLGGYQFVIAAQRFPTRGQQPAPAWHALCLRSVRRMRRRACAEQLPDSRVWILEDSVAGYSNQPSSHTDCSMGKHGEESASCLIAYGLCSPKTTAVNLKMSVFSSFQQLEGIPALTQVCSRNVCRSHFCSTGTCGSSKPLVIAVLHQ